MTTTDTTTDGKYGARTNTGPADFTLVITRHDNETDAWVTAVHAYRGAQWCPLEYHESTTDEAARTTHRAAVRRHPKRGTQKTLPRTTAAGDRCSRCGEHIADPHDPLCRD